MWKLKRNLFKAGSPSLVACIILFLVIVCGCNSEAAAKEDFKDIKSDIITAYKNYRQEVDLSKYDIYDNSDGAALKEIMTEVINETPYLFYAGQEYSKEIVSGTTLIKRIVLTYSKDYTNADGSVNKPKIKKARKKINSAVRLALKSIGSKMDDAGKALALHDYIISNTSYSDSPSDSSRVSEAGVFINHKANCQGYSLAYGILLKKAGLGVQYVTSEAMGHMWNLVRVNNAWYNVDVTWDDPVDTYSGNDQYGLAMHNYFLCSTNNFRANGHYGFNAQKAAGTKYDKMYWHDVSSGFIYRNGKWIYMGAKGISERTGLTSGTEKLLYKTSGKSLVKFNSNKYYFIARNNIYIYNRKTRKASVVWRTHDNYNMSYYVTQIKYSGGKVSYRVLKGRKYKEGNFVVGKNGMIV